jgi:hypothetical protein
MPQAEHGKAGLDIGARSDSAYVQRKPTPYRVDDLGRCGADESLTAFVHVSLVAIECVFDPDTQFGTIHRFSLRSGSPRQGRAVVLGAVAPDRPSAASQPMIAPTTSDMSHGHAEIINRVATDR